MSLSSKVSPPVLFLILILALISQACTLSLLGLPSPSGSNPQVPAGATPTPMARAEVKISVQLPEPLQPGEILAVSALDEVTGLSLNKVEYQMTQVDPITYSATFPIPDQSIVKYRYVRMGGSQIVEDTNLDSNIRYRLVYVNGVTEIVDTVNSWSGTPANTLSGSISGTVLNMETGTPLAEIMVTAGGVQTLTDSAGRFSLIGLRGGNHNLVAYALDGKYQTFQQGAIVEGNKGTPVEIRMRPAPLVNVTFTVAVPENTQRGIPIRLAGNLLQFGNTFADLRGGLSVVSDRTPILTPLEDGRYSVSFFLPAGAFLEYKYTLGDGFWNSEFNTAGQYVIRRMVVPSQNTVIEDTVQTWQTGPNGPILFEVNVPQDTPLSDVIYIQFKPYEWTEPIPMWRVSNTQWAYKLFGPLNIQGSFGYRYCRNAQCGSADDVATAGADAHGRNITATITAQDIKDTVEQWMWTQPKNVTLVQTDIPARGSGFVAGVELQQFYEPRMSAFAPPALQNIQALGSNWVIIQPTWTFTRSNPLTVSQQPGKDPFIKDTSEIVASARALNLNVALFPQPQFTTTPQDFWQTAPRDAGWWEEWFNRYRAFVVHTADMATASDSQALILGGEWITPALPNGKLADGTPSGVPADAEARWMNIIAEVRQHYTGLVLFALPYTNSDVETPINLLKSTDGIYILWFAQISDQVSPLKTDMITEVGRLLDENIFPVYTAVNKPVLIAASYPASTSSATGCIPSGNGDCLYWTALSRPNPDIATVNVDLQQQFDIYDAMLNAINARSWISGFVSRGYYAPAALQDKAASVYGKSAADLLWYWYPRLLGNVK